jgi:hypothetical protein
MSVELPCPRCGATMKEIPVSAKWLAHWTCESCDSAWHFLGHFLVQGRELRLQVGPVAGPRMRGLPRNAAVSRKPFELTPKGQP